MATREQVLSAFAAAVLASGAFDKVVRNDIIDDATQGTIAMVFDGDETRNPEGSTHRRPSPVWPSRVSMMPEVYILTECDPTMVGPYMNWLIAKVTLAIMTNEALLATLWENSISYDGLQTGLALGRSLAAETGLNFTLIRTESYADPGEDPRLSTEA
jgi:hypothetical protein